VQHREEKKLRAFIRSIGSFVPANKVSNEDLSKIVDTSDEWIVTHSGIKNRYIAIDGETTSTLAVQAATMAIEKSGIKPEEIDLIICATSTSDYPGFPSTACLIQAQIKATNAWAFDIQAACTGFLYGLELAKNTLVSGNAKNVLVVASETMSRILNWKDRSTCVLFGDGAGAAIVSTIPDEDGRGILYSMNRADGEGAEYIKVQGGGSKFPLAKVIGAKEEDVLFYMDGQKVYNFAVRVFTDILKDVTSKNNLTFDQIDYIVPHQANIRIIESAAKRLKIPMEKFYVNIQEYANTSAATIPIALTEMENKGLLKKGMLILTAAFGAGLTYGGNLIRW
jgi:3-oxoacyl-[acyl-carrier-protein] synthase-3